MSESEISQLDDLLYTFSRPVTLQDSLVLLFILVTGVASIGLVLTFFVFIFSVFFELGFGISVISSVSGGEYGDFIFAVVIALLLIAGAFSSTVNSAPLNKNQSDSILLKFVSTFLLLTLLVLKIMMLALFFAIIAFVTLILRNVPSSLGNLDTTLLFIVLTSLPSLIFIISLASIASFFAITWLSIEPYNHSPERYIVIFQITNDSVKSALSQDIPSSSPTYTIKEISKGIRTGYFSLSKMRIFDETSKALELSTEDDPASIKTKNLLKEKEMIDREFSSAIAFMSIRSLKTFYSLKHSYILLHTSSERKEFLYFSGYSDGWQTIRKRLDSANFTYNVLLDEEINTSQLTSF